MRIKNYSDLNVIEDEYYQLVKRILSTQDLSVEVCEMFEKYHDNIKQYVLMGTDIDGIDVLPEQLLYFFAKELDSDMTCDVYAMPASEHTLERIVELGHKGIKVKGFIDNYKTGLFNGLPIYKPSDIPEKEFDSILLLAQDYQLQQTFRQQFISLLPEEKHKNIIMLGKGYFARAQKTKQQIENISATMNNFISEKHSFLFALMKFPVNLLPIVRELRKEGHRVFVLILDPEFGYGAHYTVYKDNFDYIHVCDNFLELFILISKINVDVLYTMDFACENIFCQMLRMVWKGKMLYEIYGFGSLLDVFIKKGGNQTDIASRFKENLNLENHVRPILFNSVDGILYRGSPKYEKIFKDQYNINVPILHYLPYPDGNEKYSYYDKIPRIVWCGYHIGENQNLISYKFDFFNLIKDIIHQNIHFHVYDMNEENNSKYQELSETSAYFHSEKPLPFDAMTMMLRRYDWGCMAFYFSDEDPRRLTYASSFASRFLTYISAGIPIICSEEYTYMADIVRTYQNGVVVGKQDIPNLFSILKDADMDYYNDNAKRAKEEMNIQKQYPKLAKFINDEICIEGNELILE